MVDIPEGYLQLTYNYEGPTPTGKAAVVLGFVQPEELDLGGCVEWAFDAWNDNIKGSTSTEWGLTSVVGITETQRVESTHGVLIGTRGGDPMPPNVSVLMKKVTLPRGRKFTGRTYWPAMLNDGDVDGAGHITTGRLDSIQGDVEAWGIQMSTAGVNGVILHSDGATAPTGIIGIQIESTVATQRRRLR